MEAWLEVGGERILLMVSEDTVNKISVMSNNNRMDLRFEISSILKTIVDNVAGKRTG